MFDQLSMQLPLLALAVTAVLSAAAYYFLTYFTKQESHLVPISSSLLISSSSNNASKKDSKNVKKEKEKRLKEKSSKKKDHIIESHAKKSDKTLVQSMNQTPSTSKKISTAASSAVDDSLAHMYAKRKPVQVISNKFDLMMDDDDIMAVAANTSKKRQQQQKKLIKEIPEIQAVHHRVTSESQEEEEVKLAQRSRQVSKSDQSKQNIKKTDDDITFEQKKPQKPENDIQPTQLISKSSKKKRKGGNSVSEDVAVEKTISPVQAKKSAQSSTTQAKPPAGLSGTSKASAESQPGKGVQQQAHQQAPGPSAANNVALLDAKRRLVDLQSRLDQVTKELAEERKCVAKKKEIDTLKAQMTALQQQFEKVNAEKLKFQNMVVEVEKRGQIIQTEFGLNVNRLEAVNREKVALLAKIADLEKRVNSGDAPPVSTPNQPTTAVASKKTSGAGDSTTGNSKKAGSPSGQAAHPSQSEVKLRRDLDSAERAAVQLRQEMAALEKAKKADETALSAIQKEVAILKTSEAKLKAENEVLSKRPRTISATMMTTPPSSPISKTPDKSFSPGPSADIVLKQKDNKIESLEKDLQRLNNEIESQRKKNSQLDNQLQTSSSQLTQAQKDAETKSRVLASKLTQLEKENQILIKEKEKANLASTQALKETESRVSQLSQKIAQLEEENHHMRKEKDELQSSTVNNTLDNSDQDCDMSLQDAQSRINDLEDDLERYKGVLRDTEALLSRLQGSVDDEEAKWKRALRESELECDKARSELERVHKELIRIQGNTEGLTDLNFAYNCVEKSLTNIVGKMENRISELEDDLENALRDKEELIQDFEKYKHDHTTVNGVTNGNNSTPTGSCQTISPPSPAVSDIIVPSKAVNNLESMPTNGTHPVEDVAKLEADLETERKQKRQLAQQNTKLSALVNIGHNALIEEQELVHKLSEQLKQYVPDSPLLPSNQKSSRHS